MRQFNDWRIFFMLQTCYYLPCLRLPLAKRILQPLKILSLYKHNFLIKVFRLNFCLGKKHYKVIFILPLAAWDYANFYNEFTQWIKLHKSAFINPAELMLWNSHKGYLCDLQNWGINVIPTIICSTKTSEIFDRT